MPEPRLFTDAELAALLRELAKRRTAAIRASEKIRLSEAADVIDEHAKLIADRAGGQHGTPARA
jgi:hypothetical protein